MTPSDDKPFDETDESVALWQHLSEVTSQACAAGAADSVNDALAKASGREDEFSPFYRFWMAEASRRSLDLETAFSAFGDVAAVFKGHVVWDVDLAVLARERQAVCLERSGSEEKAASLYESLLDEADDAESAAWHHYEAGRLRLEAGDSTAAREHYEAAVGAKAGREMGEVPIPELARREVAKLDSEREWFRPSLGSLAKELSRVLRAGDGAALRALASQTHFTFGIAGSELAFADRGAVLDRLVEEFQSSTVRVDATALDGGGSKRYLMTHGWSGDLFAGRVAFVLTEAREGWEWFGVAPTQPTADGLSLVIEDPPDETNQPLPTPIHAPWPAGLSFRAGGVFNFAAQATAASFLPWGGLLAFAASLGDCGWGPAGFYYNQFNHSGPQAFAIDFTRYRRGLPLANAAAGIPALAADSGVVRFVQELTPTGAHPPWPANQVWIGHRAAGEPWTRGQLSGIAAPRFESRYFHLAGGGLPVLFGMWAPVGKRLGLIDDTGFSAFSHLHFSFHDRDMGFATVRPTPMYGPRGLQTLNTGEDYKCVQSVNVPR